MIEITCNAEAKKMKMQRLTLFACGCLRVSRLH